LLGLNWVIIRDMVKVISPLTLIVVVIVNFVNKRKRKRRRQWA
jgi:hypothetical protein